MAYNHTSQAHGLAPNGQQSNQPRLRVPTVHEALPYSPFSSIVPFNPDIITPPMAFPSAEPTAFHDSEDIKTARREFDRLSAGVRSADAAEKRLGQTLNDFKRLLEPTSLPEYKFKTSKRFKANAPRQKQPELSNFANLVYMDNNVVFSYATPEASPESEDNVVVNHQRPQELGDNIVVTPRKVLQQPIKKAPGKHANASSGQGTPRGDALPQTTPRYQNGHVNAQHFAQNQSKSTPKAFVLPANMTPAQIAEYQMVSPRPSPMPKAYAISATLTPAQRAEYEKVLAPEHRESPPRTAYLSNGNRSVSLDQRRKADAIVESMQSLIMAIFEAEDHMQPDTSGDTSMHDNEFFTTTEVEESSAPILTSDALLKLDAVVTKVYAHDRVDSIEVEHLGRIQKLCESFLAAAETGSLRIEEDWDEQDKMIWLGRLSSAHHGLIAARTMIRIMTGGSNHKELQSEDHLRMVLTAVHSAVEFCIIPLVEMRSTVGGEKGGPRNPAFETAVENRKTLSAFIKLTTKCVQLMGELFFRTQVDETAISSLELLCKTLIFAENGTNDRDSALGTQTFEELRKAAMDGTARIFEKYTQQRTFIVNEMLSSLDNLPTTKQSARQYTLPDAKPIQLVSALLMRLVQTSATADLENKAANEEVDKKEEEESEDSEEYDSDESDELSMSKKKPKKARQEAAKTPPGDLAALYQPLKQSAEQHARYIIGMILDRALTSSKSSDEPYRRLLDIFVDDFLNVLGSTDWPAAELLLRALLMRLIGIAEDHKSRAPARTLALELLGTIGSGILDLRKMAVKSGEGMDMEDRLSARLGKASMAMKNGDMSITALTAFEGPYRVLIEYLEARDIEKDPRLQSARGYHLMQWADFVCDERKRPSEADIARESLRALQSKVRKMIEDAYWLGNAEPDFPRPTTDQGKLAGRLVAANSMLCRAFARIFSVISKSLSSEQPTVRSRSLKSVTTLLEQDPSILDRDDHVLSHIVRCLGDNSSLVRDSALGLLQKCATLRPALEPRVYQQIVPRTNDAAIGVRKRAMAFLKQVYQNNEDNKIRASISNALISRIQDKEESVAEVARATIEEVWFSAFRKTSSDDRSVDAQVKLSSHATLIIETVELGDNVATVVGEMIKKLLTTSSQATENVRISKILVRVISDLMPLHDVAGNPSQAAIARTLNVFAKAWPKLFTPDQLSHLEPHTNNLNTTADLEIFGPVVNILRYTLPVVVGVDKSKLEKLMTALMTSLSRVPKSELAVIAPCVATLDELLGGTERPLSLIRSLLDPMFKARQAQAIPAPEKQAIKRLNILGQFGKSCDIDRHLPTLKNLPQFAWYKGNSIAGLLIEIVCYFTSPRQPMGIREAAIEAICEICQASPEHFERADVVNAIEAVLSSQTQSLERAMLASLEVFFAAGVAGGEEQQEVAAGIEGGAQRLGGTYKATGHDKASAALSQRFLRQFLRIALSSVDDVALISARIVVHINTSGLSYPQESAPGLIALETCPNSVISNLAFLAHREQFGKYESIWEKQFVKAVQRAFEYQSSVVQSPSGCKGSPPSGKLQPFWDVIKTGKASARQKFATVICASMNFELAKLQLQGSTSPHLMYVRFCIENIAFFDYTSVSEVLHLIAQLEKTVSGTGTEVAQMIESEILKIQVPVTSSSIMQQGPDGIALASAEPTPAPMGTIDPKRLEQLSVSAQILSLLWETRIYIGKLWQMQKHTGKSKSATKDGKAAFKDASKTAYRATNAPALTQSFCERVKMIMALRDTEEGQKNMCSYFVDLYTTDSEVKVGSDAEDDMDLDVEDDARSEGSSAKSPSVGGTPRGKKRKSIDSGMNGGPKKRGRARKSSISKRDSDDDEEGGWD